jgi:lysine 2,3-aminomutase
MIDSGWRSELSSSTRGREGCPSSFVFSETEKAFFTSDLMQHALDFRVTPYFFELARPGDENDPIRKEFMPRSAEFTGKDYEISDPLCEKEFEVAPLLIHRYPNRALFRATSLCAMYCRFCYRRNMINEKKFVATDSEVQGVIDYISSHTELDELLVSGGDPLVLEDDTIESMISRFRSARKDILIRLCTRMPVVLPARISRDFALRLGKYSPLRVVTQFNHPNELTIRSREAVANLIDAGIPVYNQTVLLREINDDSQTLARLCTSLCGMKVTPYYLFQGDLSKGTSHFRVPLGRGIRIYEELMAAAKGITLPVYALDLPGGGGKVPLRPPYILGIRDGWYELRDKAGKLFKYPAEQD